MEGRTTVTGPPDFVGVGAQRAGTTWWFWALVDHPQIRACELPSGRPDKELHFFDRFCATELGDADVARYHARFPRRQGQIAGEWTPRYMSDVWTPVLLRRAAPGARLLVMLRDPVERYRSSVAFRERTQPGVRPELVAADGVERGRYASQLARLRRLFDPGRILVLQYERCRADPLGEYRRTLRFLGVDEDHRPAGIERVRNASERADGEPLGADMTTLLREVLEPQVAELMAMEPELDVGLWPNFAHLAADRPAGLAR